MTCVLDEAHEIRSRAGKKSKALVTILAISKIALTGTPINNNVEDLSSSIRFIGFKPRSEDFQKFNQVRYAIILFESPMNHQQSAVAPVVKSQDFKPVKEIAQRYLLYRAKTSKIGGQPLVDLPEKLVRVQRIQLDDIEQQIYYAYGAEVKARFDGYRTATKSGKASAFNKVLAGIIRLRQLSCDPQLIRPNDGGLPVPAHILSMINKLPLDEPSSKTAMICDIIDAVIGSDAASKALVISERTQHLLQIQKTLAQGGYRCLLCEEQMNNEDRAATTEESQSSSVQGCLLTLETREVRSTLLIATPEACACGSSLAQPLPLTTLSLAHHQTSVPSPWTS